MALVQTSLALFVVFGVLSGSLWLLRRRGFASAVFRRSGITRSQMEVIDQVRLTPQHTLQLVRVLDRRLIIGVSASGLALLGEFIPSSMPEQVDPRVCGDE